MFAHANGRGEVRAAGAAGVHGLHRDAQDTLTGCTDRNHRRLAASKVECPGVSFTAPVPHFEVPLSRPGWELYGGRLLANVPTRVTVTPEAEDADPLGFRVVMTLDIVGGRLTCTSLTAERLDEDSPGITGEDLRRIPVATYVRVAALKMPVVLERHGDGWSGVGELPPVDFAKNGMTDEALEQFSRLYALIQVSGGKPSGVLLNQYGMPRATSSRWLTVARRRGILVEEHRRIERPAKDPFVTELEAALRGQR